MLNEYQKFSNSNIFTKNRTTSLITRQDASTIRWTSKHMVNIFKELNITQNKTHHIDFEFPFEKMDSKYIRHFIRGFIDGDGGFESSKGIFTITLVSTSIKFMQQLGNEFEKITEGIKSTIRKKNGKTVDYYTLRFNFFANLRAFKSSKISVASSNSEAKAIALASPKSTCSLNTFVTDGFLTIDTIIHSGNSATTSSGLIGSFCQACNITPPCSPAWTLPTPCSADPAINLDLLITGDAGDTVTYSIDGGTTFTPLAVAKPL